MEDSYCRCCTEKPHLTLRKANSFQKDVQNKYKSSVSKEIKHDDILVLLQPP